MIFLTFLLFIFFSSISICSSLTSCGPYTPYTTTFFLCDGDTITSSGEVEFQLGFFTPKGNLNKNRYVGIWYLSNPETIVWVANRDNPLPENSSGSFVVPNDGDGNLQLLDDKGKTYFSTNIEYSRSFNFRTAQLLECGNLVLIDKKSDKVLWQSFDHPTDTFLPGMKMSENLKLYSWRSNEDPATGNYRFEQDEKGVSNGGYVVRNGTIKHWTSGGQSKIFTTSNNMLDLITNLLNNKTLPISNVSAPTPSFSKQRLLMSHSGDIQYFRWDDTNNGVKYWSEPRTRCSVYNTCGNFGICTSSGKIVCECLSGFEPSESWKSGDYSGGCIRKSILCEKKQENYTFLLLEVIKVEETTFNEAKDEDECKRGCLDDKCMCQAYFYSNGSSRGGIIRSGSSGNGSGCFLWRSELVDIEGGNGSDARNISVKVVNLASGAMEETPSIYSFQIKRENKSLTREVLIISITFSVIAVVLLVCRLRLSYIFYKRMVGKRKESRQSIEESRASTIHLRHFSEEDKAKIDVPFFDLESILAATNSFSDANKLGEGGFGPVYKGKFHRGQEIAVKRLSVNSMQGFEELKNEVVLIAKLQHRNLVKLLGYCIEGDESILLYEYMQNKSLDAFIFDQTSSVSLDWAKRYEIILGIARGLLYLHQDSRLTVIHRDLKVSNILLDEDMNPKISDFGLARIVGGRETEANTNRVVGTYGYMAPEYALEGIFSIKSDVFSFGVVVLEIISGKKNTGFYKAQHDLNLLGHAWRMWKEENPLGLVDQTIAEYCNKNEVLKCIIIGLLCVQEDPNDRPNMYNVVFMLGSSEIRSLPSPKQPAFVARTNEKIGSSSGTSNNMSNNEVTLSQLNPR